MGETLEPLPAAGAAEAAPATAARRPRWAAERRFYLGLAAGATGAVVFGFARTFFLRPLFPEWARVHGAPEPIFYVHGVLFAAWFVLLLVQSSLVATRRLHVHRRLGWVGAGLALAMVLVGTTGSLIAAARPSGFIDVPVPPLQFLVVPFTLIVLFATFVMLAILNRNRPQSHKRYMLLATIALIEAGVARWPFALMNAPSPVPELGMIEFSVDLFLVPMIVWDLVSRGRPHPVTLCGGAALILSQLLRMPLAGTGAWLGFAGWAVSLVHR
jgi:hypothetical protein